jgi:hypothetical protein
MDNEIANTLIARTAALERIVTLLLADQLNRLPAEEAVALQTVVAGTFSPPKTSDLSAADDFAGRTIAFQEAIARILRAAQEIADV